MPDISKNALALVTPENLGVFVRDNTARCNSRTVAEKFNKRHADVIRVIERQIFGAAPDDFNERNFAFTSQTVAMPKGGTREEKSYDMTRDGFALLAMGFTGQEAMQWKILYIQAFNWMEQEALSKTSALLKQQEPLVQYAHLTQISEDAMTVADFARQMRQAGINTGRNRLYKWLCGKGFAHEVTKGKYLPLQKGVEEGTLQYGSRIIVRPDGTIRKSLTLFITGKGQVRLANELKTEMFEGFQALRQRLLWDDDYVLALDSGV